MKSCCGLDILISLSNTTLLLLDLITVCSYNSIQYVRNMGSNREDLTINSSSEERPENLPEENET